LEAVMHGRRALILFGAAALIVGIAVALGGCSQSGTTTGSTGTTGTPAAAGVKIALLLPETKTARYETQDRPLFEAKVKELAPDAQILYSNANQDSAQQQSQADAALTNGAQVLVLDPVDSAAAASIVTKAAAKKVPVISYDRLILNAKVDYYVSFDNEQVGKLQGQALLDKLTKDGNAGKTIVMINGAPTTPSCSRPARTASSTARSRSAPSTTRRTGAPIRRRPRWTRPSPSSERPGSSASTAPMTAPPAAPSPP
jgi:D-xylose transport system substrate-binding protein